MSMVVNATHTAPMEPEWAVCSKPWPELDAVALARKVRSIGFSAIELPVRAGYQVESPAGLSAFAAGLRSEGVSIVSVSASPSEQLFEACGSAGIPLVKILIDHIGVGEYLDVESTAIARLAELAPQAAWNSVRIGVQQHHGRCVSTSGAVRRIVENFRPEAVCAIWDAAHDALAGEDPDISLAQVGSHLGLVNLSNAAYVRTGNSWIPQFVAGPDGLSNWYRAMLALQHLGYTGPMCLSGRYDDLDTPVEELLRRDLAFARECYRRAWVMPQASSRPLVGHTVF